MKLRKLEIHDTQRMYDWMVDPEVNRFFHFDPQKITIEEIKKFIDSSQTSEENLHLACVDEADQYLGTVSLKGISLHNKHAEYAISFRKDAQGTGAAKFATNEILRIGFEELGLERIYLNVPKENERAVAFYRKMKFVYEGEFRRHLFVRGMWISLQWYAMLKPEWEDINKGNVSV